MKRPDIEEIRQYAEYGGSYLLPSGEGAKFLLELVDYIEYVEARNEVSVPAVLKLIKDKDKRIEKLERVHLAATIIEAQLDASEAISPADLNRLSRALKELEDK